MILEILFSFFDSFVMYVLYVVNNHELPLLCGVFLIGHSPQTDLLRLQYQTNLQYLRFVFFCFFLFCRAHCNNKAVCICMLYIICIYTIEDGLNSTS